MINCTEYSDRILQAAFFHLISSDYHYMHLSF